MTAPCIKVALLWELESIAHGYYSKLKGSGYVLVSMKLF